MLLQSSPTSPPNGWNRFLANENALVRISNNSFWYYEISAWWLLAIVYFDVRIWVNSVDNEIDFICRICFNSLHTNTHPTLITRNIFWLTSLDFIVGESSRNAHKLSQFRWMMNHLVRPRDNLGFNYVAPLCWICNLLNCCNDSYLTLELWKLWHFKHSKTTECGCFNAFAMNYMSLPEHSTTWNVWLCWLT